MKLTKLYEEGIWHKDPDPSLDELGMIGPEEIFHHAVLMGRRWPKGEQFLLKHPSYWTYAYARDVIQDRWPEAESQIMQDPEWAYYYAFIIIKDRWPEAEPMMKRSPGWWDDYVRNVMKPAEHKRDVIARGKEYQARTGKLPDEDIF